MSIQIADTLFETPAAVVREACHSWLYADGLNDAQYVLRTLECVPHQDIADLVEVWLEATAFAPDRDMILSTLADMQRELTESLA
jgi:hypothetical protein